MNKINQKGFAHIFFLLIIVGIFAIGGWWLWSKGELPVSKTSPTPTPTPDPTANWETYTNTLFSYQLKYPSGWEINRGPGDLSKEELQNLSNIGFFAPEQEEPGVFFGIYVNEFHPQSASRNCTDLEDCADRIQSNLSPKNQIQNIVLSNENFMDNPAKSLTYKRVTESYTQSWVHLTTILDDNLYHFYIYHPTSLSDKYDGVFNQILSTFKFLENKDAEGEFCGGIAGEICPEGYLCRLEGDYPDASGTCIKEKLNFVFQFFVIFPFSSQTVHFCPM